MAQAAGRLTEPWLQLKRYFRERAPTIGAASRRLSHNLNRAIDLRLRIKPAKREAQAAPRAAAARIHSRAARATLPATPSGTPSRPSNKCDVDPVIAGPGGDSIPSKQKACGVWQPRSAGAINGCAATLCKIAFSKPVAHRANLRLFLREIFDSTLGRFPQARDRRNILRSTAAPVFLTATRN